MNLRISLLAVALAAALPVTAEAAGLGKLTVLSALGQPLRAELDVSASRDEVNSLAARVAAPEAFRQANIEYSGTLNGVRFVLDKRPGGQPYFRLSSDRAVSDPFLDMLIELSWSSGRLVREYTFLLDPPELKVAEAPASPSVAAPVVKADVESPPVAAVAERPASPARSTPKKTADAPVAPVKAVSEGGTRVVQKGDTLARIAATTKPEGVSLDQMLVALFRSNQSAFDGSNMNRLRAGKILSIPEKDAIAAVESSEARKVIVAQAADFNAYKRKLAGAAAAAVPAKEAAPSQSAAGKITPKVEEKTPAPAGKDKLEVSRTEAGKPAVAGKAAEDVVAKEKALKEAQERIAQLEKNVADMRKLAELKSQGGADLQKQAQPAVKTAEAAKPTEVAKAADTPKVAEAPKAAEPQPKPVEVPSSPPVPAAAPAVPPPPQAKKPVLPPPPAPEPDFMEENGLLVAGGGGVIALLLGYFGFRTWKRKKEAASGAASVLSGGSVFSSAEGQSIDTGDIGAPTDFGLSDKGQPDIEGVDPVREADTYMAYGRDAQAEEILLDALKKDPSQLAVHLKLLEIYAARKSLPQFNTVAGDLHVQTGGRGADWERAVALGRALDPTNPLYSPQAAAVAAPQEVEESVAPAVGTVIMSAPVEVPPPAVAPTAEPSHEELPGSLDFDLDLSSSAAPAEAVAEEPVAKAEDSSVLDFDLDLGTETAAAAEPAVAELSPPAEAAPGGLDIDFDLALDTPAAEAPAAAPAPAPADDGNGINFDFDLGEAPALPAITEPELAASPEAAASALDFDFDLGEPPAAAPEASAPPLDLSEISLDLSEPAETKVEEAAASVSAPAANPEVTTKLELAQAYEEMGDKEGARELLQEVLAEGDAAQQALAGDRLSKLS